jgi:hypothetical protein
MELRYTNFASFCIAETPTSAWQTGRLMKDIRGILLGIFTVAVPAAVISWYVYEGRVSQREAEKNNEQKQAEVAKQNEVRSIIVEFGRKHNAVTNWPERLDTRKSLDFTADVEEALVDPSGRPVLFVGYVDDIVRRDGKYFARFQAWSTENMPDIYWSIETTGQNLAIIKSRETGPPVERGEWAIVARINSVTSFREVTGELTDPPDEGINLDFGDRTFVAKGQCVDLLFLGNDATVNVFDVWP